MNKEIVVHNLLINYEAYISSNTAFASIVFLHGWRSNKEVWGRVVQDLRSKIKDVTIYTLNLPGFGASATPTSPMTIGDYAEVVAEFIKKLELKNVVVVGHSFGGRIGIKLSATHPELIAKLVLVDSAGFVIGSQKKTAMNLAAKIAKPFFKPKIMRGLRKKIYQTIGSEDYVATPELRQTFLNVVTEDLTEHLKKIAIPTLIIFGENDKDTPVEFGKKMHFLIPHSKFLILKNAGHFSFLDQSEEFTASIQNFISI